MEIILSKILLFLRLFKFQSNPPPAEIHDNLDHKKNLHLKDRISELPDDLFTIIMSYLPLKEAARTSVISHRWRNGWKVTARLDLDNFGNKGVCLLTETDKLNYVKWVNWIVDSHEGGKLQEFRVCYALDKHFERDIDKWVKFAFSKQVQTFELEVPPYSSNDVSRSQNYILNTEFVETFVNGKFNGFKYLKALSFLEVSINDELLELILNNSPVLEQLSIKRSRSLSTFKVSGQQCVLKSLELQCCLKLLEISDVASLVSLSYSGTVPEKMIIKNVPSLIEFRFAGSMIDAMFDLKLNDLLVQFSCSLKSLTLDLSNERLFKNYMQLPKLTALEKLVVQTFETTPATSWYACLTKVCPSLREFVFQAQVQNDHALPDGQVRVRNDLPHSCLKKVKILGYYGCTRDIELALYFIQNAVALETLVIDPRDQSPFFYRCAPSTVFEQNARIRAKKQLKRKIPSSVKLVIL